MTVDLLGGLGMFLLGMILMTESLRALAGDALRGMLTRVISGPVSGMLSGAAATAVVQSSTATTITTIGFVSAGLLTFPQAVGVIFGANIGTTSTGWIVSLLGFKVSVGAFAPALVLVGTAMRLIARDRLRHAGVALAGFGLLFVGIDLLQQGMSGVADRLSPGDLPGSGVGGRLLLVVFGIIMTLVMQSSSAAMATTLAALHSNAINLDQGAALVIGQNIGTAITSAIAAIGTPAPAKRTALAHILFNALTGAVAFLLLPIFDWLARAAGPALDAPTKLAGFHTAFNILGVALLLPCVGWFSRLIERLIPERLPPATRYLTSIVADVVPVALEAARRSLREVLRSISGGCVGVTHEGRVGAPAARVLDESTQALQVIGRFVHRIGRNSLSPEESRRQIALVHAIDHLTRLTQTLSHPPLEGIKPGEAPIKGVLEHLAPALASGAGSAEPDAPFMGSVSRTIAELRRTERRNLLDAAALGKADPGRSVADVDALLWLDRVGYHLWRAGHYLSPAGTSTEPEVSAPN
ncbi:MAG: Na/Pi cotransporter family protein [Phycisphaerales bacterium]|nr:Na/Pi cotransporter family protein [Phycisphaerales bacterium]